MTGTIDSAPIRASFAKSARLAVLAIGASALLACSQPSTDSTVETFMEREGIPGAALAIASHGKLVTMRAYGIADIDAPAPVVPQHRFKIASLSKPITAAAVLSLIARGDLSLDDRLKDLLPQFDYSAGARYQEITLRHLLQHTAGWDRSQTFDPFFDLEETKRKLEIESLRDCRPIARAMLARPLQFRPGERYAYSNLGYCLLALIIEQATDQPYEAYTRSAILAPLGITHMRIGEDGADPAPAARHHLRVAGEIVGGAHPLAHLVAPENLPVAGAAGGWTASVEELIRFFARPLGPMTATEPAYPWEDGNYYGLGWRVWPGPNGPDLTHFGAMPDTYSLAIKTHDELTIVVLFNARPSDDWQAFHHLYKNLTAAVRREVGGEIRAQRASGRPD